MFGGKPAFGVKPLEQPVIWDRVRNSNVNPASPGLTEGAKLYSGGATPTPVTPIGSPRTVDLGMGVKYHVYRSPSGLNIGYERDPSDNSAEVSFHKPGKGPSVGVVTPDENAAPSTKEAINSLSEVFKHVQAYVSRFQPSAIKFSAASDSLQKVYDKAAPMMAKQLGGSLEHDPQSNEYVIHLIGKAK